MGRHSFALETLEERALFSVAVPQAAVVMGPVRPEGAALTIVRPQPLKVPFNVAGTFTHAVGPIGNPDASAPYKFKGTGKIKTLGTFTFSGQLTVPGFIQNGKAFGTFTIANSKGSLILNVVGPPQKPGVLPSSLTYSIAHGHGAYLHAKGVGKISISASMTTHKFVFRFTPTV
jgi:hypothetical protein